MATQDANPFVTLTERVAKYRGLIAPLAFVVLLGVVLVPLPPMLLDVMISLNISLAVVTLLTTIYMRRPLEFSVFPSLLLATTLVRLVLNIASTRLILTADASSPEQALGVAGKVISAFGSFVAGSSLWVGVIIFLILVIVQFVVITKGATRISEVAARFTLDAMPGKQMAIDADLNAGLIDEAEARKRREAVGREADFFGAMDGASKFVRGDAIASIAITAINILGGFAIGAIERGWPADQTARVFTTLTIGDGLTSQIPSFVIAIASALIVTRAGSKKDLGDELTGQLTSQPAGLFITAGFLGLLAFTPLPTAPLLATAVGIATIAIALSSSAKREKEVQQDAEAQAPPPEPPAPESFLKLDALELEVGYALIGLVDTTQGGDLLDRIAAVRRQMAMEMGFIVPSVRIRDNIQLEANQYVVKLKGAIIAQSDLRPGQLMAMDAGVATGQIRGEQTTEPAFGLDAWWIEPGLKDRAETMNYTVVEPTGVLATHLTELIKRHSDELLSRQEVNDLLDQLKERAPKLVEQTVPDLVQPGEVQRVLQALLREGVPIRDLESIVETLSDWASKTKDLDVLTEYVRHGLRRVICQQHVNEEGTLLCVTLDPALEDVIGSYVDRSNGSTVVGIPADTARGIAEAIVSGLEPVVTAGGDPVVLASPQVRAVVRQIVEPHLPNVAVLAYNEITPDVRLESRALIEPPVAQRRAG